MYGYDEINMKMRSTCLCILYRLNKLSICELTCYLNSMN